MSFIRQNLANGITLSRAGAIPVLWALYFSGYEAFVVPVAIVAMLTDAIDGPVARYFDAVSEFGSRWDPYADKGIFWTMVALVWFEYGIHWSIVPPLGVVGIYDLGTLWLRIKRIVGPAIRQAKLKTFVLMTGIFCWSAPLTLEPLDTDRGVILAIAIGWVWIWGGAWLAYIALHTYVRLHWKSIQGTLPSRGTIRTA